MLIPKMLLRLIRFGSGVGLAMAVTWTGSATAAEKINLRFDRAQASVSVSEIATFARTGELSEDLASFFEKAAPARAIVQTGLTQEIPVSLKMGDRLTNSKTAKLVLVQLEKVIGSSKSGNLTALQTALTESIKNDGRVSLLELMQKYPADEVDLDLRELVRSYKDLTTFVQQAAPVLEILQSVLDDAGL
jgi:hypothetical protein